MTSALGTLRAEAFIMPQTTTTFFAPPLPIRALPLLTANLSWVPSLRRISAPAPLPARVSMLRVQDKRRPEDWDKKNSMLSGRFLPMDPRDEVILDVLEGKGRSTVGDSFGPEGPPTFVYGDSSVPASSRKWNKRSDAAKKRWADPEYRAKVLRKRAEKRQRDLEASGEQPKIHKVEIGCMDSITLCDDGKAKAINDYARSNKLRSEKITAFHRDRKSWMEARLSGTTKRMMSEEEYIADKVDTREKRRQAALKRARIRKENKLRKAELEKGPAAQVLDELSEDDTSAVIGDAKPKGKDASSASEGPNLES